MSDLARVEEIHDWVHRVDSDMCEYTVTEQTIIELCTIATKALEENARLRRIEAAAKHWMDTHDNVTSIDVGLPDYFAAIDALRTALESEAPTDD